MRTNVKQRLALAAGGLIIASAFLASMFLSIGQGSPRFGTRLERQLPAAAEAATSARTIQTPSGTVRWTVIRYDSGEGPCVDVLAEQIGGTEEGRLSGCGTPDNATLGWALGGVEINDQWFNVAYGEVPSTVASVRVDLAGGATMTDSGVRGAQGLWIVVVPGAPTDAGIDVARIEALDATGSAIAVVNPPSLSDYRRQAEQGPQEAEQVAGGTDSTR